ncbi:MAG: hypothetical protein IJX89_01345 [Alphaproteobacteria bacterium]|nr:hypothetical protein [Alphaproteobacteria bacterium]
MANMKDFLTAYYGRMIFREMSHEQFVQFCGYIKNKTATDNQKIWATEYLKKDPATGEFATVPNTNIFIPKDIPDPNLVGGEFELDDNEWKKLFKAFRNAFQSMDGAKDSFKYNDDAKKFFEQYFGADSAGIQKLFQHTKAKPTAEQKIYSATPATPDRTLYHFLQAHRNQLESRLKGFYQIINDDFSYDDLLSGIKDEKYNKKPSFRKKLEAVAEYIESYRNDLVQDAAIPAADIPDFSDFRTWFDDDNIPTFRLDQFKREYSTLLNTLRSKSKVREVFSNHDNGKITGPLNKALDNLKFDDSKSDDYVQPKREDTLTMPERLSEWWSDTYSDCLEKYAKLRGDRLYFSPEAKAICKYLQKDLKKTDGLDGVLKKIGDAKGKLKAAREIKAGKHLEWFEKTLNGLKNDPKLSKVWAGALKNGTHLQALVKEIMIRAIKEGKKAEAKTALELMSVLHYDYTTSKIMDTLKKENLSIFSDKGLSWNKNEGVQFVTNALDKGIKAVFIGIGYGITMVGNAIKLSGSKITKYSDKAGNFKTEHDKLLQKNADEKAEKTRLLADERNQQTVIQGQINTLLGGRTYDVAKTDIENNINNLTTAINTFCSSEIQNIKNILQNTYTNVLNSGTWTPLSETEFQEVQQFLKSIETDTLAAIPTITSTGPGIGSLNSDMMAIQANHATLIANRNNLSTAQTNLNDLVNGMDTLNQLNAQITQHADEVRNWDANHVDDLEELVKYWNMLETGRNTHSGPMYNWFRNLSKKNAQKRFDGQVSSIISEYNRSHSIAV